jgi:endogenous inhibitor of DNA gyrase (YacG/DUF329 family)
VHRRIACAHCGKQPEHPEWRPFCSNRCKLLDLANWFDAAYLVPGAPAPNDDPADDPGQPSKE